MCRERGYRGSADHFRHMIARHRPPRRVEAFLRTTALPGEQGQVDWAHFGTIKIGRAERALLAFVCVLAYSRRIFLRFFLGQRIENFLRGHVAAFEAFGGLPRVLLYDNLKSAVLDRRGDAILFNPKLVDFAKHYHFDIRPTAVARGNEKGRVERAIRYVRTSFWPARQWRDLDDLNAQAEAWCLGEASERPWPDDKQKTVAMAFADEQPRLLQLPDNAFVTEEIVAAKVGKTPHVRFEGNDYSVPHALVRRAVEVRATIARVRIIADGEVVAEHARSFDRGVVA
jgi:transposase